MLAEKTFPVISLSRDDLSPRFTEEELAQFSDDDMTLIAEYLYLSLRVDDNFWYAIELIGRQVLSKNESPITFSQASQEQFSQWMEISDGYVWQLAGCSIYDLPDCDFRSMFDDGIEPAEAVNSMLQEAGFDLLE